MIQLQFLNKLLFTKDTSLITENNLTKDYFSDYVNEFVYIQEHLNKYNRLPDLETFVNKFPEFQIINVSESSQYLLDELYKDKNTRDLARTFNQIRECINSGNIDAAMKIFKESNEHLGNNKSIKTVDILKDFSRYDDYIERTKNFDKFYVKTGFDELDKLIGGWDREEELATIVARTNNGKSWILIKSALASAQQGLNVGLYEGEMTARKVGYRIDTFLSHISNGALIHGNDNVKLEYKKYLETVPQTIKGSLKVLTPDMMGGQATVSDLRAFIEREKLDILFIDQHSLLEDERKAKTPFERAANISRDLKNLQVMKHIPIVSVCQQNRTSTDGDMQDTTQIAQSDRIGQDSTCVLFLEKKEDILKVHLVKSRDSENGKTLTYSVDFNTGELNFIPEENTFDLAENNENESVSYADENEEVF